MRISKLLTCLLITFFTLFSCNIEEIEPLEDNIDSIFKVNEKNSKNVLGRYSYTEFCFETNLIAGKHFNVGSVFTRVEDGNLIITYYTIDGWTLDETHLTIGACDSGIFAGDRIKIGQFEHSESHAEGINEVSYSIDLNYIEDIYCFAAHASVVSSNGKQETAWADGISFGGKNGWKMYVEGNLEDCNIIDVIK